MLTMKSRAKRKEDAMKKVNAEIAEFVRAHREADAVIARRHEITAPLRAIARVPFDTTTITRIEREQAATIDTLARIVAGTL